MFVIAIILLFLLLVHAPSSHVPSECPIPPHFILSVPLLSHQRFLFLMTLYKIALVPTLNTPVSPHLSLFFFMIFINTRHLSLLFVFSDQNVSSLRAGAS